MRITGICSARGCSEYSARVDGAADLEPRLGVDLVAWRLEDGRLKLKETRVLRRDPTPEEREQMKHEFSPYAVVTLAVSRQVVGSGEPLAEAGSTRWEFEETLSFGPAEDDELQVIADVLNEQSVRANRDLILLAQPVGTEHFYRSDARSRALTMPGEPVSERPLGSAAEIDEAQDRLGIVLPQRLRELYELQDGGYVNSLCIPDPAIADPASYQDVLEPFSGYNRLVSVGELRSAYTSFLDFGDPNDDAYASYFQPGVEKMIVLAKYYQETLFLDYRDPAGVRVGYVDFQTDGWPDRILSWESFDAFLLALRLYENV